MSTVKLTHSRMMSHIMLPQKSQGSGPNSPTEFTMGQIHPYPSRLYIWLVKFKLFVLSTDALANFISTEATFERFLLENQPSEKNTTKPSSELADIRHRIDTILHSEIKVHAPSFIVTKPLGE